MFDKFQLRAGILVLYSHIAIIIVAIGMLTMSWVTRVLVSTYRLVIGWLVPVIRDTEGRSTHFEL
jgi:cell division protein FtsL